MKNNNKIIATGFIGMLIALSSCNSSFLNKTPNGAVLTASLANPSGVQQILIGAYSLLDGEGGNNSGWGSGASNWVYGDISADNSYKGSTPSDQGDIESLQTWTANSTNSYPSMKWDAMYDGIQRANDVIRTIRSAPAAMAGLDTTEVIAEARFLRGFYHLELEKVFKNIPYVDENVTVANNNINVPNWDGSNYIDPMPMIEADFQFAIDHLPATQSQVGRANKYAAEAFLAECYLRQLDYTKAKALLDDLIANGETSGGKKYALQAIYQNNFNPDPSAKNSSESVFAVQNSVNDNSANATNSYGNPNGDYGDALNFPYNNGPGACCGFNNPSQDLANAYKTDSVTGLPLLNNAFESGLDVSNPSNPYKGTLDPRIDWVMGRPGIPFLDWGPQNSGWIRDTLNDGYFNPKKNDYAKSQQAQLSDVNSTYWAGVELSATNTNIIRFATVLLWDAECEAEIGSLDQAETYVNMVRTRAANPAAYVMTGGTFNATNYTYSGGTPADRYYIKPYPAGAFTANGKTYALEAIRFEERLEFAMEGQRFFELQRWDKEDPGYMATVLNNYATVTAKIRPLFVGAKFTQGKNEIFAIPQDQLDLENADGKTNLKQNPGY